MQLLTSSLLVFFSLIIGFSATGQSISLERELISVTQGDLTSMNGFVGGLNSPQFNTVDLNRDGVQDLLVFDRVGNTPMAFRRVSTGQWQLDQALLSGFPELYNWVLLRDYDGDGVQDIFTYNRVPDGIRVFKGSYNANNRLEYEQLVLNGDNANVILTTIPGGTVTQIFVSNIDYPDINDIDCDGDLDVLTFSNAGGRIEFFQNQSVELGYGRDSLIFFRENNCYGGIFESGFTETLDLAGSGGECATGFSPNEVESRHVGSTLLTLDEDGDGDKDLILGDLAFDNLNMSTNNGTCEEAWMSEQDPFFPSYNAPAMLANFPAAFYLDIDGDGERDLVSAPNTNVNGQDIENVWFYRNTGTDNNPTFELQQTNLLVGEMIDVGTQAKPALLDYNADGLMDLVVGNLSFFEINGFKNSRLYLYENIGTTSAPAFELIDDDFLNMSQFSIELPPNVATWDFAPTFGDMDGDGDMDAIIGERVGQLFYFENTAGAGNPVSFGPGFYGYMDIDAGLASTPHIVDLNRDGLADLVVGEFGGSLRYYQNVGTESEPAFISDEEVAPNIPFLGNVDGRILNQTTGYSAPFFIDYADSTQLFMGTEHGTLEYYGNITGNVNGDFAVLSENIMTHAEGSFLTPVFYDWDNDGFLELVVGNERGGLSYFSTNLQTSGLVNLEEGFTSPSFNCFPNPTHDLLTLEIGEEWGSEPLIQLFNTNGQLIQQIVAQNGQQQLSLDNVPVGVYWIQLVGRAGQQTQKLIKH